jgi:pimeloyl-ACP methyl ester carboxylesterase
MLVEPSSSAVVLVHGAWQTAATWDLTVPELQRAGHQVFVAKLTGLEGSDDPITPHVTLDTHIADVLRLLESEDIRHATLVGHSYAGMIVTGVADRSPDRIEQLVYADAFLPDPGESALQLLPPPIQTLFREQAAADGEGWRLSAGPRHLDLWGLKPGPAREFVKSRLSDFSLTCFEQPLRFSGGARATPACTYIECVADDYPSRSAFKPFADKARQRGWVVHALPTGHDCHVEMPKAFAALLSSARRSA